MQEKLKVQNGKILLWRLGDLKYSKQNHDQTPRGVTSGMWAFPWPYFDIDYAYHKYSDALPKRFHTTPRFYPANHVTRWYAAVDGYEDEFIREPILRDVTATEVREIEEWLHNVELPFNDMYSLNPVGSPTLETCFNNRFQIRPEFYREREEWINNVGKKVVKLKKFYYEGDVFIRLGKVLYDDNWVKTDVSGYLREVKRRRGVEYIGRVPSFPKGDEYTFIKSKNYRDVGSLELFLPRGGGRISGVCD